MPSDTYTLIISDAGTVVPAPLSVDTATIVNDAVTADKLRDSVSVDGDRAVTTNHIRNLAVTTDKINDLAVTTGKLGADSVTTAKIADSTGLSDGVTSSKLATSAVVTSKIADNAVDSVKLKSSVSTDGDRAVTTDHIRNSAVTYSKLQNAGQFTVLGRNAAGSGVISEQSCTPFGFNLIASVDAAAARTTLGVGATASVATGGTGLTSYSTGDILYASGSTTLATLSAAATGNALISGGVSTAPAWGKIGLTTHVTGTLPVANGGTGAATLTGILKGNGTSAVTAVTAPVGTIVGTTDTQVLTNKTVDGSSNTITNVALSNTTGTLPVNRGGTGATTLTGILVGNGTSAVSAVAAPSGDLVGTSATQTLTNKTLTSPTISTPDLALSTTSSSALGKVSWDNSGSALIVGSGSGTKTISANDAVATLTNKTIDASLNTITNLSLSTAGGTLAVANGGTGATTLTGILKGNGTSAVTAVTAPTGAIVGTTDTQTLTNKTLTAPTVTSPVLTLDTTASNSVGRVSWDNAAVGLKVGTGISIKNISSDDATATLTNKTIDGGSNTISNVSLSASTTGTLGVSRGGTGATTLTGILVGNGTSAFTAVAAPLSTVVGTTDSQTLTNKTINGNNNTITNIDLSTATTGNVPVNRGGTGATSLTGILVGNGTSAVTTVSAPSGDIVGTSATQTLSGKTISGLANTITNISLSTSTTGSLPVNRGGTGLTGYSTGQLLYASSSSVLSGLNIGSTNHVLRVISGVPAWGSLDLSQANTVGSSILPEANGGTGFASLSAIGANIGVTGSYDISAVDGDIQTTGTGNILSSGSGNIESSGSGAIESSGSGDILSSGTGEIISTGSGKIGYGTGAGGIDSQSSAKTDSVTIDKPSGTITTSNAALNANTSVTFTFYNSLIDSTDLVVVQHVSGGTAGAYTVTAFPDDGYADITIRNVTSGSLSQALSIRFVVIKAANT